jgi:hypothetical protein
VVAIHAFVTPREWVRTQGVRFRNMGKVGNELRHHGDDGCRWMK